MKQSDKIAVFGLCALPLVLMAAVLSAVILFSHLTAPGAARIDFKKEAPFLPVPTESAHEFGDLQNAVPVSAAPALISRRSQSNEIPYLLRDCHAVIFDAEERLANICFRSSRRKRIPLFVIQQFFEVSLPPRAGPVTV